MVKENYDATGLTIKDAIQVLLDNDLTELFNTMDEVIAARCGEATLQDKELIQDTAAQTVIDEVEAARDGEVSLRAKELAQDTATQTIVEEVETARDGEPTLLEKEQAQDTAIQIVAEEVGTARDGKSTLLEKEQAQDTATQIVANEVEEARDGRASLLEKEQAQDNEVVALKSQVSIGEKNNYYFPDPLEADQGVNGNGFTIKDCIDAVGSKRATIFLKHNSIADTTVYTVSTDLTIPENICFMIENGAIVSVDNGITLAINGAFEAGLYQVFSGAGSVCFGSYKNSYPIWFGADNTGVIDSTEAWNKAVESITSYGTVKATGSFLITGTITIDKNCIEIVGEGGALKILHAPIVAGTDLFDFNGDVDAYKSRNGLKNTTITGGINTRYLIRIYHQSQFQMEGTTLYGEDKAKTALFLDGSMYNEFISVNAERFIESVLVAVGSTWMTTTTDFYNCSFSRGVWSADITDSQRLNFIGCTFQSTVEGGVRVDETGVNFSSHVGFINCHFENNLLCIRAGYGKTSLIDVSNTRFIPASESTTDLDFDKVYAQLANNSSVAGTKYLTYTTNIKSVMIIQNGLSIVPLEGPSAQLNKIMIVNQDLSSKAIPTFSGTSFYGNNLVGDNKAQRHIFTQCYSKVINGAKLIIPFIYQVNLESTTVVHIIGHSAKNNSVYPKAFEISFACGHWNTISNLDSWGGIGNYANIEINGMNVEISFTSAYSEGVFVTIEYMTNQKSKSIDIDNISLD